MWHTYVALGDSLTQGYGDPVAGVELRSWTDWLAEALAPLEPDFTYRNVGLVGSGTTDILRRQVPPALAAGPDLVSITTGANDTQMPGWSADAFAQDFERLLRAVAGPGVTLLTMTYPDFRAALPPGRQPSFSPWQLYLQRMAAVNASIRRVSHQVGACLLDFETFASARNPACASSDLVHPNALGYKQTAEAALRLLAERFDLPPDIGW